MKKFLILLAALAGISAAQALEVHAADVLPAKAIPKVQPAFLSTGYTGSGFYFGLYTQGGGGAVNGSVAGVGSASLTTTSASIGALGGYAWTNQAGNVFFAGEAMFGWQNFNGNAAGLAFSGPASFKIGTPLNTVLSILPTLNLPTVAPLPALPTGVTAGNVHPYLMAGVHEDAIGASFGVNDNSVWRVAPSLGLGAVTQLSNGTAVDVWAETIFPEKGVCVGAAATAACGNIGQQVKAGLSIIW